MSETTIIITINVEGTGTMERTFSAALVRDIADGPTHFTTAVEVAQDVLGQFHKHYCPTDEEAAATADDAAPAQSDDA
jgi:hypothetical protein